MLWDVTPQHAGAGRQGSVSAGNKHQSGSHRVWTL